MSTTPLSTDFKDDILASSNPKRKYQMIYNDDGSVSFTDVTQYDQTGSIFGAKEVNEERAAINNIDERRIVTLDEIDLVTEEGFFVDALAVAELNRKFVFKRQGDSEAGICMPHYIVITGTIVLSGANADYRQLFSASELLSKLKFYDTSISNFDSNKCVITTSNGDGNAAATHFYAPEWWKSHNAYFQYFYPSVSVPIRVNYCIHYINYS